MQKQVNQTTGTAATSRAPEYAEEMLTWRAWWTQVGSVITRRGLWEASLVVGAHLVLLGPIPFADEAAWRLAGSVGVTPTPGPTCSSPHAARPCAPIRLLTSGYKGRLLERTSQVAKLGERVAAEIAEGAKLREGVGRWLVGRWLAFHVVVADGTIGRGEGGATIRCSLLMLLMHARLVLRNLHRMGPLNTARQARSEHDHRQAWPLDNARYRRNSATIQDFSLAGWVSL